MEVIMPNKNFYETPNGLGEAVQSLRQMLNLTQVELANLANVSRSVVAQLEQQNYLPYTANIIKLCDGLDVFPAELYALSFRDWKLRNPSPASIEIHKIMCMEATARITAIGLANAQKKAQEQANAKPKTRTKTKPKAKK